MFQSFNMSLKWLIGLLVLLLIILFLKEQKKMKQKPNDIAFEFYLYLKNLGFEPATAKMIVAQAAFETGNFTSNIFKNNNNLFGMKLAKKRITTATGEKFGHAVYDTVFSSIQDYKYYYKNFAYPERFSNVAEFVATLKKNKYFEAEEMQYKNGVEHYYKLYWNE